MYGGLKVTLFTVVRVYIVHPGKMSNNLNDNNFLSIYATNTEQTSLCCICSGASSAVIRFLFEWHLTKLRLTAKMLVIACVMRSQPVMSHIFCSYRTGGMSTQHFNYVFIGNHLTKYTYTCVSGRKHCVEANVWRWLPR